MCRYAMAPYKTHFACLTDRRSAKHPTYAAPRCQDCGHLMIEMGRDFHVPRRENRREWRKIALLVAAGRRAVDPRYRSDGPLFDSCGCSGPGPRPATLTAARELLRRPITIAGAKAGPTVERRR